MSVTATDIHDRLTEMDSDDSTDFALAADVTESDVGGWLDGIDTDALADDANDAIGRTTVTDLSDPQGIGGNDLSVADVIESHNDDPDAFEAAYILRPNRTIVQYHKPWIGGKEPIGSDEVDDILGEHVSRLVDRVVAGELMERAREKFGQS